MRKPTVRKRKVHLSGGPFHGGTIYMSGTDTLVFKAGDWHGRYVTTSPIAQTGEWRSL